MTDADEKIWDAFDVAAILDMDVGAVRRRAWRYGITSGKRGGNHRHGPLLMYSDNDIAVIRDGKRKKKS